MKTNLVGLCLCLHLVLAQALFFDLLKDNKLIKRKSSSQSWSGERRTKKKAEYVCRSSKYSQSTRRQYNCPTETTKSEKYSGQISGKNSQPCYDDNKYCASWASLSECSKNPSWMLTHCPIACGLCTLCEDFNIYCEDWARRGECSTNRKYMKVYCKKSCSVCSSGLTPPTTTPTPTTTTTMSTSTTRRPKPACRDRNYKCTGWARRGYCSSPRYYRYMKTHCPRSCNKCYYQHP